MEGDWLRLYRSLLDHEVFQDPWLLKLFIWCLLKANYKPSKFQGQPVGVGQFVTGRHRAAEDLGVTASKWYRGMQKLSESPFSVISLESNSKWTTVTVCNYSTYQNKRSKSEQQTNSKRTASEQQTNTIEERNNSIREEGKNITPNGVCSEPDRPDSEPTATPDQPPPVLIFPVVGKGPTEWPLTAVKLREFSEAFPALDVLGEFRKALLWCQNNPAKRKTFRGMPSFLGKWLGYAQDHGAGRGPQNNFSSQPKRGVDLNSILEGA